jgi:predicted transcriptional regulator
MSYAVIAILGVLLGVARAKLWFAHRRLVLAILRARPGMYGLELVEAGRIPRYAIYVILSGLEEDGLISSAKDMTDTFGRRRYWAR